MHYDKLSDLTDQETRCTMLSANLWPVFIFHLTSPLEHDFRSLCAACLGIRSLDSEDSPTPRYLGSLSQCASARNLGVIPPGSNFAGRKINIRASQRFPEATSVQEALWRCHAAIARKRDANSISCNARSWKELTPRRQRPRPEVYQRISSLLARMASATNNCDLFSNFISARKSRNRAIEPQASIDAFRCSILAQNGRSNQGH